MSIISPYNTIYRAEIDGLRAFAVLSVVIFHSFPSFLKGGFVGVDVFFVISGFLISKQIFDALDNERFKFIDFFGRRIIRIFPALILVMACSLFFGWFALFRDEIAQLGKYVSSGAGFIVNFIIVGEAGYFDNAALTKPMLHLWSLAVEEQFYIIWPLLIWTVWKVNFDFLKLAILVATASFFLNLVFVKTHPEEMFFLSVGRFWELISGGLLAWIIHYKGDEFSRFGLLFDKLIVGFTPFKNIKVDGSITSNLMSFIGLLFLTFAVIFIDKSFLFPSTWALIPVLGSLLVIGSGSKSWPNRVLLMNRAAIWFGLISYPLYLWHWPILSFLYITYGKFVNSHFLVAAIIMSIVFAWLTFRFIEIPIRRDGNRGAKIIALLVSMILIGLFALIVSLTEGRILPLTPKQVVADTAESSPKRKECHFPRNNDFHERYVCEYFNSNKLIGVFGNSHSVELAFGLAQVLKNKNFGVRHHTMSGCVHNYGSTEDSSKQLICAAWQKEVLESLISDGSITSVVISYRNEGYLNEPLRRDSLVNMLNELVKANKNVVLVLQAPMPLKHIKRYIREEVFSVVSNVKGRTKENWLNLYNAKKELLEELPNEVKVYNPAEIFCDLTDCYVVKDGVALFFDDDHLSVKGAELVAKELLPLLNLK